MTELTFKVAGEPVPKGRPRFGRGVVYTPEATRQGEGAVGWAFKAAYPGSVHLTGPVGVTLHFAIGGDRLHADIDNYVKLVLDGLNTIAWRDDRQVEALYAYISKGNPVPHTRVFIRNVVPEVDGA